MSNANTLSIINKPHIVGRLTIWTNVNKNKKKINDQDYDLSELLIKYSKGMLTSSTNKRVHFNDDQVKFHCLHCQEMQLKCLKLCPNIMMKTKKWTLPEVKAKASYNSPWWSANNDPVHWQSRRECPRWRRNCYLISLLLFSIFWASPKEWGLLYQWLPHDTIKTNRQ